MRAVRFLTALLVPGVTGGCSDGSQANDQAPVPMLSPTPVASPSRENTPTQSPMPAEPPQPDHNYDERRGWTYYYIAAVSEEEEKRGRAVGDVHAFQYLGLNDAGEHLVAGVNSNGIVSYRAKCPSNCRIIDTDYGQQIAYSPRSIIGGVFQDAIRGKLRVADWAKDEIVPARRMPAVAATASPTNVAPAVENQAVTPEPYVTPGDEPLAESMPAPSQPR